MSRPSSVVLDVEKSQLQIVDEGMGKTTSKSVGLKEAYSLTVGMIVGSGIFMSVEPTFNVFQSNSIGMVALFWIAGGLIALTGGLCYAELGTRIPESGGERAYYKKALNKQFGQFFVIVYVFIVRTLVCAALASTAAAYIISVFSSTSLSPVYEKLLMITLLIFCTFINCLSKNIANKAGIIFTVLKMSALFMLIGFGIYYLSTGENREWKSPFATEGFDVFNLTICFVNVFWSYEGWNSLGLVAGEMNNPSKDLPIALSAGVITVTLLYAFSCVSYSAILGFDVVRNSGIIAKNVADKAMGKFYFILPLLVACSALGAMIGTLFSLGCVCTSAGFSGELPRFFSLVHSRQRTPIIALVAILMTSFLFVPFEFKVLLNYCAFITWAFYLASFISLIRIKYLTRTEPKSGFRVPTLIIIPLIFICLFVIVMVFVLNPVGCGVILAILLFILAVCYLPRKTVAWISVDSIDDRLCSYLESNLAVERARSADVS